MSNFGCDYPIFNWYNTPDPLGTILDSSDPFADQILEWDLTKDQSEQLTFQQLIEQIPPPPQILINPQPLTSYALLSMNDPNSILMMKQHHFEQSYSAFNNCNSIPPLSPCFDQPILPSPAQQQPQQQLPLSPSGNALVHYQPDSMETVDDDQGGLSYNNNSDMDHSSEENEIIIEKELSKVKLQASKSPIMDALVYCALNRWGIELLEDNGDNIRFRVLNFQRYYKYSGMICAKQNPTEDIASRIKALKRWFPDFPTKRAGNLDESFEITVQLPNKQDNKPQKLHEIIEKQRRLLGVHKITRQT